MSHHVNTQRVEKAVIEKGLLFSVKEFTKSTRTAQDAAAALDCELAQIIKSLLFCTIHTREPILILASGSNRVNEKIIEQYIGEKIIKADAAFTQEVTGFVIGGVSPVGHIKTISTIFIDEDLLKYEILWAAAGTPHTVFSLPSAKLEALTVGKVVCIK